MDARIEQVQEIPVIALRHIGPYYLIGEKFKLLNQWAQKHNVAFTGAIGLWHDNPETVPAEKLRSDACLIVSANQTLPSPDGLELRQDKIAGGDYGVTTFLGPYEGLMNAWPQFFGDALPKLGRQLSDAPCFESYLNDCSKVQPEEIRTDLYVKLK
jgi:AraC family transcriptional regulator